MIKQTDYSHILLLSDLDGTFLNRNGQTVPRNMEALSRFMEQGGRFSFATGRVQTTIERFILPGYQRMINAPSVMCNGACVYDAQNEKILHEVTFDGRMLRPVVEEALSLFSIRHINIYAGKDYFCYEDKKPSEVTENVWHKIVFSADPEEILKLKLWAGKHAAGCFRYFRSADFLLEFLPEEAGKGKMLRWIREMYQKQGIEVVTYGIGDYENDLDLLEHADHSACPVSGLHTVRDMAEYIVCSNDEGAVADLVGIAEKNADREQNRVKSNESKKCLFV